MGAIDLAIRLSLTYVFLLTSCSHRCELHLDSVFLVKVLENLGFDWACCFAWFGFAVVWVLIVQKLMRDVHWVVPSAFSLKDPEGSEPQFCRN